MEITYRRNLQKSYMCVKEQEKSAEEYELNMLEAEQVPYLLKMEIVETDGEISYLYDISGKQQIEDYLSGKKMDYEMFWKVLLSIKELCFVLQDYLLRETGICLKAEYIYVNLGDGSLYFTYLPFWRENFQEAFGRYMEQILRIIDHQDQAATELAYQVYQMSMMKNISIQKILEASVKREKEENQHKKPEWNYKDLEWNHKEPECENILEQKKEENELEDRKGWDRIWEYIRVRAEQIPWMSRFFSLLVKVPEEKSRNGWFFKENPPKLKLQKKPLKESFEKKGVFKERFSDRMFTKGILPKENCLQRQGKKEEQRRDNFISEQHRSKKKAVSEKNILVEKEDLSEIGTAYPTEILGLCIQEPVGKLIYQGIHGCKDILVAREEILIGKNKDQAEGVIEAEGISRLHARISRREGVYYLEDLNSTNGTYLNGEPIAYHQQRRLCKNDRILFGAEEYLFS